jgi:hypothetical protein
MDINDICTGAMFLALGAKRSQPGVDLYPNVLVFTESGAWYVGAYSTEGALNATQDFIAAEALRPIAIALTAEAFFKTVAAAQAETLSGFQRGSLRREADTDPDIASALVVVAATPADLTMRMVEIVLTPDAQLGFVERPDAGAVIAGRLVEGVRDLIAGRPLNADVAPWQDEPIQIHRMA